MSFLLATIRLGLKNLRLHKLRSILTSLGIVFGVAAVILMVSIGEGNKRRALREIESLGATNIILRSQKPPESSSFGAQERSFVASFGLKRLDFRRLEENITTAKYIVPLKSVGDEISFEGNRLTSQAFGTTPMLADVANIRVEEGGRYLSDGDLENRASVAVIGSEIAAKFFNLQSPIGKDFRIGQQVFRVIGVLRPVGLAGGAGSALVGRDLNFDIHIPLTTANLVFSDRQAKRAAGSFAYEEVEVSEVIVTAHSTEEVQPMAELIERLLEVSHPEMTDVQVIVPWELLETAEREALTNTIMLIAIAAVSLLVGGIGIMNIMLATVTERTREIGIRRALGATRTHIVTQFIVETGAISAVGGVTGILLGVGASLGIRPLWELLQRLPALRQYVESNVQVETFISGWSIVVSFVIAALVGIAFGMYPALVASRKDPIVALRHD